VRAIDRHHFQHKPSNIDAIREHVLVSEMIIIYPPDQFSSGVIELMTVVMIFWSVN